jgi:hypothetical protein
VRLADGPEDFAAAIAAVLTEADDLVAASCRREVALRNSWQARGVRLRALLAKLPGGAELDAQAADGDLP